MAKWQHVMWLVVFSSLWVLILASKCPDKCICSTNLKSIRCEHQKLTAVPVDIPHNVTELYLGNNMLTTLHDNDFQDLTQLVTLSLKKNILVRIEPKAFAGLTNLKNLFLTANKLTKVPDDAFKPLKNVINLYLAQNMLTAIPEMGQCVNMKTLGLDNNKIKNVTVPSSFSGLTNFSRVILNTNPMEKLTVKGLDPLRSTSLTKLELSVCTSLKDVENGSFAGFKGLKSLDLSYNPQLSLPGIQNIIAGLSDSALDSLDISGSLQVETTLPDDFFLGLKNVLVHKLLMRNCKMSVIANGTFQYLPLVNLLDLSQGTLIRIEDGSFQGMTSLLTLRLKGNLLQAIPGNLPKKLMYLDLSNNIKITEITENIFIGNQALTNLSLSGCGILRIDNNALVGLAMLTFLDLSHNMIGGNNIGVNVFANVPNLHVLDLSHNKMTQMSTEKNLFSNVGKLQLLDMSQNNLKAFAPTLFEGLTRMTQLNLNGNSLGNMIKQDSNGIIFRHLAELDTLDISSCDLSSLPDHLFTNLSSVKTLNLHGNWISHWSGTLFDTLTDIKLLNMSFNRISSINEQSMSAFVHRQSDLTIDFLGNPFDCYCELVWFRDWIKGTNSTLASLDRYKCSSPTSMANKTVVAFNPSHIYYKFLCNPIFFSLVGAGALFIILVPFAFILHRRRYRIQLWYYRLKHKNDRYERLQDEGNDYLATVSYHDDDEAWFLDTFLPRLLQRGFEDSEFYYKAQDSESPGMRSMEIMECLIKSTASCHKTLFMLSLKYVKDGYTKLEMNEAIREAIESNNAQHSTEFLEKFVVVVLVKTNKDRVKIGANIPNMVKRDNIYYWECEDLDSQNLCVEQIVHQLRSVSPRVNPQQDVIANGHIQDNQDVQNIQV